VGLARLGVEQGKASKGRREGKEENGEVEEIESVGLWLRFAIVVNIVRGEVWGVRGKYGGCPSMLARPVQSSPALSIVVIERTR
jgi:hypothetical protein